MRTIQSLDKGLQIFELICDRRRIRLKEAAELVEMTSSNAALFLNSLILAGYVEKKDGHYSLTNKVSMIDPDTEQRFRSIVRSAAEAHMVQLHRALNENVLLAVRAGMKTHYLLRFQSDHVVQIVQKDMVDYPIHVSAHGKVILAYESSHFIADYMRNCKWERFTAQTIDTPERLAQELETIRRQEYAANNCEYEPNVMALAAPIRFEGAVRASLVVQFPTVRHSIGDVVSHATVITETARAINQDIVRDASRA